MLSIFQTDLLRFVVYIFPLSNNVNMFWIIEKSLKQLTKNLLDIFITIILIYLFRFVDADGDHEDPPTIQVHIYNQEIDLVAEAVKNIVYKKKETAAEDTWAQLFKS